jgi:DHA2 family multidrug resistance protein
MTTIIHIKSGTNRNILLENINQYNPAYNERINSTIQGFVAKGFPLEQARSMATQAMEGIVSKQVMLTTYNGMYLLIGVFTLLCIPLIFFQPFSKKPVAMPVDAH